MNSNYCKGSYSAGGLCGGSSERQCCKIIQAPPSTEFRAIFIATAFNVDWPTGVGFSTLQQQEQLTRLLDKAVNANLNAVIFQVRPAADAVYDSSLEPWSRALSGTQGQAPNPYYDPLAFCVSEAHKRGLEVHAWLNPYRGNLQPTYTNLAPNHICNTLRKFCYVYGKYLWLDPGAQPVADRLIDVISDIVTRYDVDGIHFDDYFYPYPDGSDFPDNKTYNEYLESGGTLGRNDWRRNNVNRLVERVYNTIHSIRPTARFSISPFGIYKPQKPGGMPPPIVGLDPYEEQYADTKLWLQSGWVDFFAPQLYWKIDPTSQSYPILLDWWLDVNTKNRHIYAANAWYRVKENNWSASEITNQITISRDSTRRSKGSLGNIGFSASQLKDNVGGLFDQLKAANPNKASVPAYPWLGDKIVVQPLNENSTKIEGKKISVELNKHVNTWTLFKIVKQEMTLLATLPSSITSFEIEEAGRYAVQARNKANVAGEFFVFQID